MQNNWKWEYGFISCSWCSSILFYVRQWCFFCCYIIIISNRLLLGTTIVWLMSLSVPVFPLCNDSTSLPCSLPVEAKPVCPMKATQGRHRVFTFTCILWTWRILGKFWVKHCKTFYLHSLFWDLINDIISGMHCLYSYKILLIRRQKKFGKINVD